MARFVRIGNVVLDPTRVKVARIQAGEYPELRMMLRSPEETVHLQAQSEAEASAWLDDLGQHCPVLRRVQQALLPVTQVRMAEALPARKVKGKLEGPGLILTWAQEKVTLPTDSLAAAEAFLDELLEAMPGGAWVTSEPAAAAPAEPTPLAPAAGESGPALDSQDLRVGVLEDAEDDAEETPWADAEDDAEDDAEAEAADAAETGAAEEIPA